MNFADLKKKLISTGQEHVLQFFDELSEPSKQKLVAQLQAVDLDHIDGLVKTQVKVKAAISLPREIKPVHTYPRHADENHHKLYADALNRGHDLLKHGKVAAFLVAGGQGTRLGHDGPKGEFPVTPIRNKPLFQVFAEQLLAHSREAKKAIPWYIMTSDANDTATRAFFKRHNFFGYDQANIMFFQQGMMPAFGFDGKMLLAAKDSLALSPDGHGGSFRALEHSGALADMKKRGVEHLSYFQVDNPLVYCIDPLFIGLHDLTGSEMSSKTVTKAEPLEKVGNFVIGDGVLQVIEYSDLPKEMALQMEPDSKPRFNSGSIAIHAVRVSFAHRLNAGGQLHLPWHRAEKKVPYVDAHGKEVKPHEPNAVKLEQFVFDAIPLAKNSIVYTTDRAEEFSPVKNAHGVDSPATCKRDQIRRAARWLKEVGVQVPMKESEPDAEIEISPLYASNVEQLKSRKPTTKSIVAGEAIYLE